MPNADDWTRLGQEVKDARKRAGYRDMAKWATTVGRSTRMLLGLERGEPVGENTLELIEDVLQRPRGWASDVLSGKATVRPETETPSFVAKATDQSLIRSRGSDEQGLWEEMARVRAEMDRLASEVAGVKDDVRAIRQAVAPDGGA